MLVLEFKTYGKPDQFKAIDEAIRVTQFIRNKSILSRGLATVGHTGSYGLDSCNAWGDQTSTLIGANLSEQVRSPNQESPCL